MKPLRTLGLALLVVWSATAVAGPPDASDPLGQNPLAINPLAAHTPDAVRARLIADATAWVPGRTVTVGVHLAQDPGWHTYWRNGGDSGLPTEVFWDLPDGFEAGPLQWPTPHKYEEAGGLTAYGYSDDVVLLTEIRVPEDAEVGRGVAVAAHVTWLMCKELCIAGEADVRLELPVARASDPASGREARLLADSRARVPQLASSASTFQVDSYLDLNAVPAGQTTHAAFRVRGVAPDTERTWFPLADDALFPGRASIRNLEGDLVVVTPLEVDVVAEAGRTIPWGGVLELRPADVAPVYLELTLGIPVATEGAAVEATHADVFESLLGFGGATTHSIWYYLLLAFLGGVILNVMPCVLPVISLKVLGFVQHAGEDRSTVFRLGLLFAIGVLVSFLALALVVIGLQAAGDQLGWGFQFQNPMFVMVMAMVVFAFGLSLFGVYEIILPVTIGAGGTRGAYAESFFNGVLATALATPCTAPFMGPALGFAFTQSAPQILGIFLAIGVGLSVPYVLLSVNPGWLRFVPKPGAWMERFKQAMGFLLMATLVWLLWVLGQQLGTDALVWSMAFLVSLGFALWLYGSMLDLSSGTARRVSVWLLMILIVGGSWRLFLTDRAFAEPQEDLRVEFSPMALEQAVEAGQTVFVDFTAAWCWTCKVNEKTVLASDAVQDKMEQNEVLFMVGDWTKRDPVITEVLRQYGRSGVPFYIVFPAGRMDDPIPLPEVITEGIVLDALDRAGPSRDEVQQARM